jgi:hypothetical protein
MSESFAAGSSTLFHFLRLCSPPKGSHYVFNAVMLSTIITDCNKLSKLAVKFKSCCNTSMMHLVVIMTANGVLSDTSQTMQGIPYFASVT